jgi:hypothetical protein
MTTLEMPTAEELAEQAAAGFRVDVPTEPLGEPVERDEDDGVILCPGCGTMYDTVHGLHVHMARKHPEIKVDKPARRRTTRASTDSDVPDGAVPGGSRRGPVRMSTKTKRIKAVILDDFNPVIIEGLEALTKMQKHHDLGPGWDMKSPTGKTYREETGFSDFEAGALAKGIVEVGELDALVKIGEKLGPLLPYAFGVFALAVIGFHTYKVLKIRDAMIMHMAITAGAVQSSNGSQPATQQGAPMTFV